MVECATSAATFIARSPALDPLSHAACVGSRTVAYCYAALAATWRLRIGILEIKKIVHYQP